MKDNFWLELRDISEKILIDEALNFASDEAAGAVNFFVGTVRNHTKDKKVSHLFYEAYQAMALSEIEKIALACEAQFLTKKIYIVHALGALKIGDIAVLIAVSCPHRAASFEACRFIIEEIKKSVPIWKQEFLDHGEVWVSAFP